MNLTADQIEHVRRAHEHAAAAERELRLAGLPLMSYSGAFEAGSELNAAAERLRHILVRIE